jgi:hypothetical protein
MSSHAAFAKANRAIRILARLLYKLLCYFIALELIRHASLDEGRTATGGCPWLGARYRRGVDRPRTVKAFTSSIIERRILNYHSAGGCESVLNSCPVKAEVGRIALATATYAIPLSLLQLAIEGLPAEERYLRVLTSIPL